MSIRILRVQFREPVHIGNRTWRSLDEEHASHITTSRVPDGVHCQLKEQPSNVKTVVFVPNENLVSLSFEPEAKAKS